MLAVRNYNFLRTRFEQCLLQVDHDRGGGDGQVLTIRGQTISGAWGHQAKVSGPAPKVYPWGFGDEFCPPRHEERLRTLAFGAEAVSSLPPETALDGIVDCRRIVEAIRAQAETGPVNLNWLARGTGLIS